MTPRELSTQPEAGRSASVLSQEQLVATAALALVSLPAALVSTLPQAQFPASMPTPLAVLLALVGFACLLRGHPSLRRERWIAFLMFGIFVLRLSLALGISRWWWWPQVLEFPANDWDKYENMGWDLAQSGLSLESLSSYALNEVGFVYLIGALYSILGRNPLALTVFFTFLGAWIALDLAEVVALTGGRKAACRSALLASVMPASLFLGALPAKDILVTFCFLKLLLILLQMQGPRGWSVWGIGQVSIWLLVMGVVRPTAPIVLLISLGGIFALERRKAAWSVVVFTGIFVFVGYAILTWRSAVFAPDFHISPLSVSGFLYERTGGYSATLSEVGLTFATDEASSIALRTYWDGDVSKAYLIPLRAMLMIFVPFPPTTFTTLDMALSSFNTLLMLLLLPAAWAAIAHRGTGWQVSSRELSWLWLPMLVHVTVLSAALPFVHMRYSLPAHFLYVGLAAVGLRKDSRLAALYMILPLLLGILYLLYIAVKGY